MKVKLGDYIRIMHGYAFKTENYVDNSEYRLVTLGNFQEGGNCFKYNDGKATFYGSEFPDKFILKAGDLILPLTEQVIGLFGNSAFVPKEERFKFVLNQRVGKIEIVNKGIDRCYLHYLLATPSVKYQLEARASGTKQRNISPDDVYDVIVDLPEYEVQQKIGNFLYNIELKQESNNKINAELESMAKTLYDYWFLQFEFPNEEGKPYKSSGGKMVWNDELKREIPEGWEVKKVSDISKLISGYPFDSDNYKPNGKYNIYTIGNVQDGYIVNDSPNKIDYIPKDIDNDCILKRKDIIMSLTGNVGRVGLVFADNALLNQRVLKIIPNDKYELYLYMLFRNPSFTSVMQRIAGGTSQKNLSPMQVSNYLLVNPSEKMLIEFNKVTVNIINTIVNNLVQNQELASLRDFLLPMLMNGQVTFK